MQFRLVGLKYSSYDGRTYYAEEIGLRSLPNINSVVPVSSFRSMSALSPIHAAVTCYFSKTGLVPSYWTLTDMRQTPKEILGTNLCLSKSFTNARQNLVRILLAILHTHLFPLQFSGRSCFVPLSFV